MSHIADIVLWFQENPYAMLGVLIALILYVIYSSLPEEGVNPLENDSRRAKIDPIVVDKVMRKPVIKQKFKKESVPGDLDVIVIGSGMGGLAAAGLLAKSGKKCLVLERHDVSGGCLHTFRKKGFEFDVGVHYIGELGLDEDNRILIDQLTDGQLQWDHLDNEYDVVTIGKGHSMSRFSHMTGLDAWREKMLKQFPDEEKAITKWIELCKVTESQAFFLPFVLLKILPIWLCHLLVKTGIISLISNFFKYNKISVEQGLDKLTSNKQLKACLAYNWGDYGTLPAYGGLGFHTSIFNHFVNGAYYPRGGAGEFSMQMIPVIEKNGGKVLVKAPVTQILTDTSGKVTGVRVQQRGDDPCDIFAPIVISDAGLINTFKHLLPGDIAIKYKAYDLIDKKVSSGVGGFSVFVGLKGTTEELGVKAQNIWSFTGEDVNQICEDYLEGGIREAMESDIPILFTSFPSAKDSSFQSRFPGKSTCVIVTLANYDWFAQWKDERAKKRGEDYKSLKYSLAQKMWDQVCEQYPQLKDKVEYFEAGSPLTNTHYFNSPKGEIYGLDHSMARFTDPEIIMNLRPDCGPPGLYLTGQDVMVCGVSGALAGAVLCAGKILNRNIFNDVTTLKKQLLKQSTTRSKSD